MVAFCSVSLLDPGFRCRPCLTSPSSWSACLAPAQWAAGGGMTGLSLIGFRDCSGGKEVAEPPYWVGFVVCFLLGNWRIKGFFCLLFRGSVRKGEFLFSKGISGAASKSIPSYWLYSIYHELHILGVLVTFRLDSKITLQFDPGIYLKTSRYFLSVSSSLQCSCSR